MSIAEKNHPNLPDDPNLLPLDELDPSQAELFERDVIHSYFERLRNEDPVHLTVNEAFGRFWSVTKFEDIMAVDTNHKVFSSEPTIVIGDLPDDFQVEQFISMDQPKHDVQRKAVSPTVDPRNLASMEDLIRDRTISVLDSLPTGEEFDWVPRVSIELTTRMLATLFDMPFEDRHLLPFWSDLATSHPAMGSEIIIDGKVVSEDEWKEELGRCVAYFSKLWLERQGQPDRKDFISMLANNPATKDMINNPLEMVGNLTLLIVGGNDTTRNSMTGGILALNENPAEYDKLRNDHGLIPNMVSEIIRWQTPLAHMRRTALNDAELNGKQIKKGDKVVMWYISGNRDKTAIDRADQFIIDRPKARHHLSFGYGIHRCMGNRVGEMQLRILWEEVMKRFDFIEVVGKPKRSFSNFVHGFESLPVILHPKTKL